MTRKAGKIKKELKGYYPHLNKADIRRKIRASENAFLYFRAFIPWFHGRLRGMESDFSEHMQALMGFQGWCVGDPHLENFGVVRIGGCSGKFSGRFTVNDPDDGGPGPLAADVVRYLAGILIRFPNKPTGPVFEAYYNGLSGGQRREELVQLEQLLLTSTGKKKARADKVKFKGKLFKLEKLNKEDFDELKIRSRHRRWVEEAISGAVGDRYKVCSNALVRFRKKGGGSGGLKQFRVLLMPKGVACSATNSGAKKAVRVVDLKHITRAGICGWHSPTPPAWPDWSPAGGPACGTVTTEMVQRVEHSLALERGSDTLGPFPRTLMHPRLGPCLVRVRCSQEQGVNLKEMKKKGLTSTVIALEADVMGRLHAASLPAEKVADFRSRCEAAQGELCDLARRLAARIERDFNVLSDS